MLIIIFVTLHLSACSTEDFLAAIAPEIGSGTEADINGINLTAKIYGVDSGNVIEDSDPDGDNLLEVSGKLDITDYDPGEEAFIAKTVNGDYGIFDIDTAGNWNYAAGNQQSAIQNLVSNATLTENLVVSSVDGTTHIVTITIIGVIDSGNLNNAAVITGNDLSNIQEDLFTDNNQVRSVGKLNITDSDAGQAAFIGVTINGNYGALNIDISGNWFYVLNNSLPAIQSLNEVDSVKDTLVISSVDGTTHNITITIWGANEVNQIAIITGIDTGTVTEDVDPDGDNLLEIGGKLNITDSDAGEAVFTARTVNGNYGSLTINTAGNWHYAASNNQSLIQNLATGGTLTENLIVSSIDGTTHTVKITITGTDENNALADIHLSWVAPAEREDNSAISLSEIAGYKVSYGMTQGQYINSTTINDGTAVGYTFTDFPTGTYYFVVTTLDTEGRESQYSTEVKIII
jgi:VCBS repeat-containing protein